MFRIIPMADRVIFVGRGEQGRDEAYRGGSRVYTTSGYRARHEGTKEASQRGTPDPRHRRGQVSFPPVGGPHQETDRASSGAGVYGAGY